MSTLPAARLARLGAVAVLAAAASAACSSPVEPTPPAQTTASSKLTPQSVSFDLVDSTAKGPLRPWY